MARNSYTLTERTLKGALPDAVGEVVFVDSAIGNVSGDGSSSRPFSTIEAAFNKTGLSSGDVIVVMPGHAETVSAAAGIIADIAGVKVVGMGEGAKIPTITFSATASTITVTAASISFENVICVPSIDSVVSPFVVSAADVAIGTPGKPVQFRDASSTVEFVRGILTTAAADNFSADIVYKGVPAGNACVNAIRLVGANNARINIDFYGNASTAVVEFITTACTNVNVKGYIYNSASATGLLNIVDTQGSSTWSGDIRDGITGALQLFGSAGNGVYDPQLGYRVTKVSNLADGAGTDALFTVNGRCLITSLTGEVTTVVGGAATMKLTDTTNTVDLCAATTIDTDAVGTMYALPGLSAQILNGTGGTPVVGSVPNMTIPSSGAGQIIGGAQAAITVSHILDAADTGAVTWVLWYKPLVAGATIVAAA